MVPGGTIPRAEHLEAVPGATPSTGPSMRGTKAGFEDVGTRVMSLGGGLVMWGRRSGG